MPYMWVPPEVFLEHKGVVIYHVYRDDNIDDPREYWYGYSETCSDEGDDVFDVRTLPNPDGLTDHADIIRRAIDMGILTQEGIKESE